MLAGFVATAILACATPAPAAVLASGLQLIERNYLFTSELDAQRLLQSALSYAEARLPEVRAIDAEDGGHVLEAGPCRLRLEIAPGAALRDLEPALEDAAALIDGCATDRPEGLPSTEALLLNGVFSGLDPYSTVFDAEGKEEHAIQFQGALAGIGARIGLRDEKLTLINVYAGSPAAAAGLRDGDVVRRIDGASTTNLPVSDAVQKIRGAAGTIVRLEVERKGEAGSFPVGVTRALVTIPSVEAQRLDNGVVYAAISHFSQTTPTDFRTHVAALVEKGGARGVIIDLRANSGGSMLGSAAIADMFLDEGILITTSGRNGAQVGGLTPEIRATHDTPFRDLPVVVLTSSRTASGSELLAASLRNHDRAVLVGERTFGKGTVQKTYSLGTDSSLKMTVGHFLPNGLAIPGGGLTPDVELRTFVFDDGVVWPPDERSAEKLPFWLRTPAWLRPTPGTPKAVLTSWEEARAEQEEGTTSADDDVVVLAAALLYHYGSTSADRTLDASANWLAARASESDTALRDSFRERGIDWRAPSTVASAASALSPDVEIQIEAPGEQLTAGSDSELTVTVKNNGPTALYRVYGRLVSKARFLDGRGVLFGYLASGEARRWQMKVKTPATLQTSRFPVRLELFGDRGRLIEAGPVYVAVAGAARPRLSHRVAVAPSEDPETLDVTVEIRNVGEVAAEDVRVFIEHPESDAVELVRATATAERLAPGESRKLELQAKLLKSPTEPLVVKLLVSEGKFKTFYEAKVELSPTAQVGAWQAAPDIRVGRLVPDSDKTTYKLLAEAVDDEGLASFWCRIDGKKVEYIDARDEPRPDIQVELPWHPSEEGQHIEIVAIDADGLRTTYVADL